MSAEDLAKEFEGTGGIGYPDVQGRANDWQRDNNPGPETLTGLIWTQAQADDALMHDLAEAALLLQRYSPGPFINGALDALTDFVFNEGSGHYRTSTLMTYVNMQNWSAVKAELLKWDYAGAQVIDGLERRREAEAALMSGEGVAAVIGFATLIGAGVERLHCNGSTS